MANVVFNPLSTLLQSLGVAIKADGYCREKLEPSFNAFKSEFDAAETRRREAAKGLETLFSQLTSSSIHAPDDIEKYPCRGSGIFGHGIGHHAKTLLEPIMEIIKQLNPSSSKL